MNQRAKTPSRLIGVLKCSVCLLLPGSIVESASGSVLLLVDVSHPGAVTVTATTSPPVIDDSSSVSGDGVTLLLFFSAPGITLTGDEISSSGLRAAGMEQPYSDLTNTFAFIDLRDVNLYRIGAGPQIFAVSSPAFIGSMVLDFEAGAGGLPPIGTFGDIAVGDTVAGSGAVIGQWQAIPEPGSLMLAAIGLAMAGVFHRGRR